MSDDLAKGIAKGALRIEWEDTETAARRVAEYAAARIEELERMLGLADDQRREWERHCRAAEAKLAKAVEALDEAVYLLDPDDEDIAKETGLHRIVTTLAALKGDTT